MREELFAHLCESVESLCQKGIDRSAAEQRAIEQLGRPEELRRELQSTVSWADRWSAVVEKLAWKQRGESTLRFATRIAGLACLDVSSCAVLFMLTRFFFDFPHRETPIAFLVWLAAGFVAAAFVYSLAMGPIIAMVQRGFANPGDVPRALAISAMLVAFTVAAGTLFNYLVSFDTEAAAREAVRWLVYGSLFVPLLFVLAWVDHREKRPLRAWLELDIAD